jgi:hypothetical protein
LYSIADIQRLDNNFRVIDSFNIIDIKKNMALSTEISFRAVEALNEIPKKISKQTVYI